MPFTFGSVIPGSCPSAKPEPWDLSVAQAEFFGVEGASLIVGARHSRTITIEHWLHNTYANIAAVRTAFKNLEKLIGQEKTLTDSTGEPFNNCVLLSVAIKAGPVNSPPIGWMYDLTLTWRQLKP